MAPAVVAKPAPHVPVPVRTDVVDRSISTYNGAKTAKYNWSQSIMNVDIQIPIPEGTNSRQLLVKLETKRISIRLKSSLPEEPALLEGELCEKIKTEDSFWSVDEKRFCTLNLEKASETIWK
jgi:hypothetical protein